MGQESSPESSESPSSMTVKDSVPQLSQENTSLYEFHKPSGLTKMQLLLFHGLQTEDSLDAYWQTWQSEDGSCFWPQAWLTKEFPDIQMFCVSYHGHVGKTDHGNPDMYSITENLVSDLLFAGIGQIPNCLVVLVGHCFGGLVIKELCLKALNKLSLTRDKNEKAQLKSFLDNLGGIFFYGTLHHGNPGIDKVAKMMKSPLLPHFKSLSKISVRLNYEFDQLHSLYPSWRIGGLGENLKTISVESRCPAFS